MRTAPPCEAEGSRQPARRLRFEKEQADAGLPRFERASQNLAAAATIVRALPESADPAVQQLHHDLRQFLEVAACQQAASSSARGAGSSAHRGPSQSPRPDQGHPRSNRAPPTHSATPAGAADSSASTPSRRPSVHERVGTVDARHTLEARRRAAEERERVQAEHLRRRARRGGRFDREHERSLTPEPAGPKAFGRRVLNAPFPARFRAPTNIGKYAGETNPSVWLEDYRLACRAGGATDDNFVIQYLPIYLADSARSWLEYLPGGCINS